MFAFIALAAGSFSMNLLLNIKQHTGVASIAALLNCDISIPRINNTYVKSTKPNYIELPHLVIIEDGFVIVREDKADIFKFWLEITRFTPVVTPSIL